MERRVSKNKRFPRATVCAFTGSEGIFPPAPCLLAELYDCPHIGSTLNRTVNASFASNESMSERFFAFIFALRQDKHCSSSVTFYSNCVPWHIGTNLECVAQSLPRVESKGTL